MSSFCHEVQHEFRQCASTFLQVSLILSPCCSTGTQSVSCEHIQACSRLAHTLMMAGGEGCEVGVLPLMYACEAVCFTASWAKSGLSSLLQAMLLHPQHASPFCSDGAHCVDSYMNPNVGRCSFVVVIDQVSLCCLLRSSMVLPRSTTPWSNSATSEMALCRSCRESMRPQVRSAKNCSQGEARKARQARPLALAAALHFL